MSTADRLRRPRNADRRAGSEPGRADVSPAVYWRLRDLIVDGRLAPGAPLIEADLTKRLGASRTPVRAAISRLQQEGFVAASPVGQALRPVVAPLTSSDMTDVFLMAGAFEGMAARDAAVLDAARLAVLLARLDEVMAALETAGRSLPPDVAAERSLDGRFHRTVAGAGAGSRLPAELDVLYPQATRYSRAYALSAPRLFAAALDEHRALVQALRAGDAELAGKCASTHWRRSLERLQPALTAFGEQGIW